MRTETNFMVFSVSITALTHMHSFGLLADKKNVLPCRSSQPAAGVSPIHAEADRQVPHLGERYDGAATEETF